MSEEISEDGMPPPVIPDPVDLLHRLDMAIVASCSCQVKTDRVEFHDPMCRYRLISEAANVLRALIDFRAHPGGGDDGTV